MAHETRAGKRERYDDHTRVTLLEDDADTCERNFHELAGKLDSFRNWLMTGAITFAFSAILLGVNVALQMQGR